MKVARKLTHRGIALLLVLALCGLPSLAQTVQSAPTQQPSAPQETQTAPAPTQEQQQAPPAPTTTTTPPADTPGSETYDPTKGPLQPAPTQTEEVPDAPSAVTPAPAQTQTQTQAPAPRTEPVGTAAAEKASTVGGAASKPAGAAIAPAKQKQSRSWLIKLGALAGAGVALGVVYGLSRGSPSAPPGSR